MDLFSCLTMLGGLALFLYGMDVMGDGLKKLAGGKLERILEKLTSNNFKGFLLGFFVTAVIQSSSATIVMLVGFVNSGILKLSQSMGIIIGANLGTTVTSWILSLTGIDGKSSFFLQLLKPSSFTPVLAVIGICLLMFAKNNKKKDLGAILIGFGVLMFGMDIMSDAVSGLKESDQFQQVLIMFENPVMGILVGTVLTAIIQSSSASVGILQALAVTGAIPFATAVPVILGCNIGTTITGILSSLNGNSDAKRVSLAALYMKIFSVIVFCFVFYGWNSLVGFKFMEDTASPLSIAIFHTLHNVFSVFVLLPLSKLFVKLVMVTVKGKNTKSDLFGALDERFLSVPAFAVEKSSDLVCDMFEKATQGLKLSSTLLNGYNSHVVDQVRDLENEVDKFEDKINTYLVKVSGSQNLSEVDSKKATELLHVIGDIERISDHSVNIVDAFTELNDKELHFSEAAMQDLEIISNAVNEIVDISLEVLRTQDVALATKVEPLEQVIDRLKRKIKDNHIVRLKQGDCTAEMGFILSDLLTNFERVADHCSNIAVCVIEIQLGNFETHAYLRGVKRNGENNFAEQYEEYKKKYALR